MDTDAKGQLGGMDASEEVRRRFARQSVAGRCASCGKTNEEIMKEQEEAVKAVGGEGKGEEVIPEELRLAYRDDLGTEGKKAEEKSDFNGSKSGATPATPAVTAANETNPQPRPASGPGPVPPATAAVAAQQQQQQIRRPPQQDEGIPAWIDKAIYGVIGAIIFLVWKKYFL